MMWSLSRTAKQLYTTKNDQSAAGFCPVLRHLPCQRCLQKRLPNGMFAQDCMRVLQCVCASCRRQARSQFAAGARPGLWQALSEVTTEAPGQWYVCVLPADARAGSQCRCKRRCAVRRRIDGEGVSRQDVARGQRSPVTRRSGTARGFPSQVWHTSFARMMMRPAHLQSFHEEN